MKKNDKKHEVSIHSGHRNRMRKKLLCDTNDLLEPHELLEILLFYCIPRRNTNEIAHNLIEKFGSISAILNASQNDIENVFYLSRKSSSFISALGELKRRIEKENKKQCKKFPTDRSKIEENIGKLIGRLSQRGLYIIFIDGKGRKILAKRIRKLDGNFGKDIAFQIETFEIKISGAYVIDYLSAAVDIPSLIELEKIKYIETSLNAVDVMLYDYYLTDGFEALSVKNKNAFLVKNEIKKASINDK